MADLLVTVLKGPARFSPDVIVEAARATWPDSPQSPPAESLGANSLAMLEVHDGRQIILVDFLGVHEGLGVDGDDDLAGRFLAWLTNHIDMSRSQVVVSDWADDLIALAPGMRPDDVARLRGGGHR
ncbi:hypothetical protein AAG589_07815 [Isoptericola sp. F-RaC21]|uniref:hypothetical protein n=1 Tax=Isoptericola sp. F-RaC21 TaxID=3141452 RepID=UPI00315BEEC5